MNSPSALVSRRIADREIRIDLTRHKVRCFRAGRRQPPRSDASSLTARGMTAVMALTVLFFNWVSPALADQPAFLKTHSFECHSGDAKSGGLDLSSLLSDLTQPPLFAKWERIHDRVASGEMPPQSGTQPKPADRAEFVQSLGSQLGAGINVLIVDFFAPMSRDPQGIHKLICDEFKEEKFTFPDGKNRTLVSYANLGDWAAFVEPIAIGDVLRTGASTTVGVW